MMTEEKRNKVIKKGLKAAEKLQFFALILLSLLLIAGVDLITANVGWNQVTNPYFYISNIVTDVALLLITFGTVYLVLDYLKEHNEVFIAAKKFVDDFAISTRNVPTILSKFLEQLNRKRKINQYEYNILFKLYKLENRKKWYAYLPIIKWFVKNPNYYTEEEMHVWNYGTDEEKAKSQYCRKRKMYEEQLDKDLIEKIIDMQYVKYDKVTSATILSDYYNKGNEAQVNDFVTKNETAQIARYRVPLLILSFGFTFLIASLVLDSINLNWLALITISSKLLTIAWNVFTSYRYAKKHFNGITLHDVLFRRSLIVEYDKWVVETAETQQDVKQEPIQIEQQIEQKLGLSQKEA
jgi:hypothetical protein